jgi:hypothetical protein
MTDEHHITDENLASKYARYSDRELAEAIFRPKDPIPDWQKKQFIRLLQLRRRSHYQQVIGLGSPRPPQDGLPAEQPSPSGSLDSGSSPSGQQQTPKKGKGCGGKGCLFLIAFAAIAVILLLLFSST